MKHANNAQAAEIDTRDPARILTTLPHIPLVLFTLLAGKTLRPFLAELSGLSPSRLRRGKKSKLRDSTEQRALNTAQQWFMKNATEQGWSEAEITTHIQSSPSSVVGKPRPYADFIHGIAMPCGVGLPLTTAFAEEVDTLVVRLLDAHSAGNLEAFKQAILECNWGEGVPRLIQYQQAADQQMEAMRAASDWDAVLAAVENVFENLLLCFFAALDAEFGLIYFKQFKPRPLFLLVMPKMNPQINLASLDKLPSRNLVYQPARRLLELSHAMMIWIRDQRWPDKTVGRKELGEALDLADQQIGNFFDGTRNMNAKVFDYCWVKMCQTVAKCEPFPPPLPLVLSTTFWQSTITRDQSQRLKSFLLPDEANYTRLWTWHHQRWASQLDKGTVDWPAWLGD